MSKSKIGVFSILAFGVLMLLIPATSIVNAQEYDRYGKVNDVYFGDNMYYEEIQYSDRNGYYEDKYVYEEYYYPPSHKDKKEKEPSMLLVKKDVLYCDSYDGSDQSCRENGNIIGLESGRYGQDCTTTMGSAGEVCNNINEETFTIMVTDKVEFPGSENGTKLTFNGERFTVTENVNVGTKFVDNANSLCQEAGFDSGFFVGLDNTAVLICTLNEGDCSGIIQDGELKECTVKNYVISNGG